VDELLKAFHKVCGSPVRLCDVREPEMLKAISLAREKDAEE
jgi:hypothetical protein